MPIADVAKAWTELGDAGQAVAGAAALVVVLSVWVALRQLRFQARSNHFAVYDGFTRLVMDTDRVFIEYPEMRKYFYDREPPPTDAVELARALAIAELMTDFMDHVAEHIDEMDPSAWEEWEAYFKDLRDQSPILDSFVSENREWYCDRLRKVFKVSEPL